MLVKHLKPNKQNPRTISDKEKRELKAMMLEYGDLGCIVYNKQTDTLVSGHQRVSQIGPNTKITYEKTYDTPTRQGTIAEGFIEVGGEKFKYREVSWDLKKEKKAMLAANKAGGRWDRDMLGVVLSDINFEVNDTGFSVDELRDKFKIEVPDVNLPEISEPSIGSDEESDAEFMSENPGSDSSIQKENINTTNEESFSDVEEKAEPVSKKFIIIIDCPSFEAKDELKEKLLPLVTEAGAKIF